MRERDLRTGTLNLFDIPLLPAFRQLLRVYDVAAREGAAVRVRFYRVDPSALSPSEVFLEFRPKPDKLLAERVVPLVTEQRLNAPQADLGYTELGNVGSMLELQGVDRIRIEVTPLTAGMRFWAFVSVTNDETQHVTVISPQ